MKAQGHMRHRRVHPVSEPPGADPHAGRCGEGRLEAGPYPIRTIFFRVLLEMHGLLKIDLEPLNEFGAGAVLEIIH